MLKSKKDEAIKRYLSKVGKLERNSKLFGSRYYIISYGDNISIRVRFSDHFNGDNRSSKEINIVRTSVGLYIIQTTIGVNFTVREKDVIPYLKSLLLLFPEIRQTCGNLMSASAQAEKNQNKAVGQVSKLEALIKSKSEEFDLADSIWDENKKLQGTIKQLHGTVQTQKTQYAALKEQFNAIKSKYDRLAQAFSTIKGTVNKL